MKVAPKTIKAKSPGRRGGARPGAGRKKGSGDPRFAKVWVTVGALPDDWDYLAKWSDGNAGDCLAELLARCRSMWPNGPASNPITAGTAKPRPRRAARKRVAK
jgi:hypothetical protein